MSKLWRRATGKIKDRNSILILNILSRNSRYRQPDLEAAIIKATSHDETHIDYKNARRVFTWVQASPSHLMVFLWALTRRAKRTQNWVVALKSLILLHGVLCTKAPGTRKIGRLPFDLSSFEDGQTRDGPRRRACSEFVQAYFAFCDMKSVILSAELRDEVAETLMEEAARERAEGKAVLVRVHRWQELLDTVLEVRPVGGRNINDVTVLEAMDCMVIEVFELYSKICDGIAKGLMSIYKVKAEKEVASMALDILHKASRQGRDLSDYFHFCTKIGILHLTECPKIQQIPEDDFFQLKKIINGDTKSEEFEEEIMKGALVVVNETRDVVMVQNQDENKSWLKTVISDKWEVFDEEIISKDGIENGTMVVRDPFEASLNFPPVIQFNNPFIDYGGTSTTSASSQLVLSLL
ncbi:putative clathrin assembly protein At1g25240 [Silene latifolia]|uniref:putative clathrin assembly protein At1g25240 n=1 Tax=Silene latifolia TaxID=37657 RepID=UPI003D777EB5